MIKKSNRKEMSIKYSGRSTDFISPTFIMGCGFNCSYCYCKRHKVSGVDISKNTNEILTEIDHHSWFANVEKPNQTHKEFITYDIGCNTDVALHYKHMEWNKVFNFFKNHQKAFGSFATKYVNRDLLSFNPNKKVRIRFSLMPQKYSDLLEPNTSKIIDRIKAIDEFLEAGYEVHINFSPVIIEKDWIREYSKLFQLVNDVVKNKSEVKAEVIFLTHNEKKHIYNLENKLTGENLLWKPEIQESKISQYGGENIRYNHKLKNRFIQEFKDLHKSTIDWNTIRYIF